ncbi:MAG: hypothetical protein DWQ01_01850 [Planctomycetota bacterium]|nr:MAG: hypothetical protein DWQ01_01850 [Planctomycetota bacterium]
MNKSSNTGLFVKVTRKIFPIKRAFHACTISFFIYVIIFSLLGFAFKGLDHLSDSPKTSSFEVLRFSLEAAVLLVIATSLTDFRQIQSELMRILDKTDEIFLKSSDIITSDDLDSNAKFRWYVRSKKELSSYISLLRDKTTVQQTAELSLLVAKFNEWKVLMSPDNFGPDNADFSEEDTNNISILASQARHYILMLRFQTLKK